MSINAQITLTEDHPLYKEISEKVNHLSDDQLLIVARSWKNRKADTIPPIEVKNGIYFYVAYDIGEGNLAFPTNKPTPELISLAKANTIANARIGDIFEIVDGKEQKLEDYMFPDTDNNESPQMIIISNASKVNGSGILYCEEFLRTVREKMGDFYILPSSIHEIILVPEYEVDDIRALTELVRQINEEQVSDADYLADEAFPADRWVK